MSHPNYSNYDLNTTFAKTSDDDAKISPMVLSKSIRNISLNRDQLSSFTGGIHPVKITNKRPREHPSHALREQPQPYNATENDMELKTESKVVLLDSDPSELILNTEQCVLYVYAPWCQPCKIVAPVYENLSTQRDDYKFLKIDIEVLKRTNMALAKQITVLPTFLVFRSNKLEKKIMSANIRELVASL